MKNKKEEKIVIFLLRFQWFNHIYKFSLPMQKKTVPSKKKIAVKTVIFKYNDFFFLSQGMS